ncbi:MAG: outer membrane beta-barrel protein [Rickettsiales bacterium]|jgi:opacity protein-like surface antigen|nr:outer membrane beta-barrel protein [Rickettsiales bacterium]
MKKINFLLGGALIVNAINVNAAEIKSYISGKTNYSYFDSKTKLELTSSVAAPEYVNLGTIGLKQHGYKVATGLVRDALRVEIEFGSEDELVKELYLHNSPSQVRNIHASIKNQTTLLNLYYDVEFTKEIGAYLTLGYGFSHLKLNISYSSDNGDQIKYDPVLRSDEYKSIYQLGLGFSVKLSEKTTLDIGYRYYDLGNIDVSTEFILIPNKPAKAVSNIELKGSEFALGVRYNF